MADVRTRAKSSTGFSDVVFTRRKDRSLDLTAEEKTVNLSPLNLAKTTTSSDMSTSSPVTASTLNDDTSSFTVYESPQEEELEVRSEAHVGAGKTLSWQMRNGMIIKVRADTHEILSEQKPSQLLKLSGFGSNPELVTAKIPPKLGDMSPKHRSGGRDADGKTHQWVGVKLTPRRAGVAVRKVWRSILGRT
jgi:hypothetical protein